MRPIRRTVGCAWGLVAMIALAGCVRAELRTCGDLVCAADAVCIDGLLCATPEQLSACDGLTDGDLCQTGFGDGYCERGVCTGNACGDGQVTGSEGCDGDEISATCEDLGYYAGTPSCTPYCVIDRSTCVGRCGDGLVQREREDCDGTTPAGSCVGYGRDFGLLGCSRSCAPDILGSCRSFGWRPLVASTVAPFTEAAANGLGALGVSVPTVYVSWRGATVQRDNPGFTRAAASPTALFAIGDALLGVYDDAGWRDLPLGAGPGAVAATEGGIVYVVDNATCGVTRVDPVMETMVSVGTAPGSGCRNAVTIGEALYVASASGGVLRYDGAWTVVNPMPVERVIRGRPGYLVVLTQSAKLELPLAAPDQPTPLPGPYEDYQIEFTDDGDEVDLETDEGISSQLRVGKTVGSISLPDQVRRIARAADGTVIGWYQTLYRFDPQLTTMVSLGQPETIRLHLLDDGALLYLGSVVGWREAAIGGGVSSGGSYPWNPQTLGIGVGYAGDPRGNVFLVGTTTGVWRRVSGSWLQERVGSVAAVAGTGEDAFVAQSGAIWRRVAGVWTNVTPPGCVMSAVVGRDEIHAMGQCDKIYRWDGAMFVEIATTAATPLDPVVAADGTLFVRVLGQGYRLDGATLVPLDAMGTLVPVSRDDVFVQQQSEWLHLFAAGAAPVRLPTGAMVANPRAIYVHDPATQQILMVPRMPGRFAPDGL